MNQRARDEEKRRGERRPDEKRDDAPKEHPFDLEPERDDRHPFVPTRAKLFVPYFPGDVGDRSKPFPPGVLSWWCEGLRVDRIDGTPYLAAALSRDETYTVTVEVANGGTAAAWAQVALYWADPSVSFGPPHLRRGPELGSPCMVHVPPGTIVSSLPITLAPKPTTPDHICLLAVVSSFDDPASGSWDPLADRHYAQHNIDLVQVSADSIGSFWFFATNPLYEDAIVSVRLKPAQVEDLRFLSTKFGTDALQLAPNALGLITVDRAPLERRPDSELELELAVGERRLCQALVSTAGLHDGQLSAITVEMRATPARGEHGPTGHGSFGAVVFVNR